MSHMIQWTWQNDPIPQPTLAPGQSVDYYTYTINLYMSYDSQHSLRKYSLSIKDLDTNQFSTIQNYESVSNANDNTISVDANGLITADQPEAGADLDIHTLVFKSNKVTNSIILTTLARGGGWGTNANFVLSEVEGSVSAEVVPEPSDFALLLGLFSILYIRYKKRFKV